jgi:hypothetical protein
MTEKVIFDINFRLQGRDDVRPGWTAASDPQEAIENFLTDYSPSMGRIVWIEVVMDESSDRRNEDAYDHIRDRKVVEKVELQSIRDTASTVTPYRG